MPRPKEIIIDPTDLSAEHDVNNQGVIFSNAAILEQLYFQCIAKKRQTFFYSHFGFIQNQIQITLSTGEFPITLTDKNKKKYKTIVKLNKLVVARRKGKEFRFDVLGDLIGKGAFKYVYDIDSTYAYQKNKGLTKKPNTQPLVMLVQSAKKSTTESIINKEIPYLCSKEYVIAKKLLYQAVRKLPGVNYKEFNEYLTNHHQQLTIDQRLILSINLLKELKQLHDLGIIHRDLKRENIMVIDEETLAIKFIDFGLSIKRGISPESDIKAFVGSPAYSAPEYWLKNKRNLLDKKSDIWSLYLLLWMIWEGTNKRLDDKFTTTFIFKAIKKNQDYQFFQDLFQSLLDLDDSEKTEIKSILALDQPEFSQKNQRKSLRTAIEVFENLRLNRLERLNPIVFAAYSIATKTSEKLAFIAQDQVSKNPLEKILDRIKMGLEEIDNSPDAVFEFIRIINIKTFEGLTTKDAIFNQTENIINNFKDNINNLLILSAKIEEKLYVSKTIDSNHLIQHLQDLFQEIQSLFVKESKCKVALDDLAKWNISFNKKFDDLSNRFETIDTELKDQANLKTARFRSYSTLVENLKDNKNDTQLQTYVKSAIRRYFYQTFSLSKSDRAASTRRLIDMQDILQIFVDNKELDNLALIHKINQRLNRIKTGMPSFFGRSQLRKNIRIALHEFSLLDVREHSERNNNQPH